MKTLVKSTVVVKNYSHDTMKLRAKFPSGAKLLFSVGRTGETLEVRFSNNRKELAEQAKMVQKWLQFRKDETNQDRFDRLEMACNSARSGKEFIAFISYSL